jgi:hypothetical protein
MLQTSDVILAIVAASRPAGLQREKLKESRWIAAIPGVHEKRRYRGFP